MKYIKDWKTFKKINEAEILDTTSPAETTATETTTDASKITVPTPTTTNITLSDDSKKLLEQIKKDNQLPYISTTTPKGEKYKSFVKLIQEILKFKGSDINPDGDFGVKTKDATIKFQTDNNLTKKEGIVGEETWTSLLKICGLEVKPKMVNTKVVATTKTSSNTPATEVDTSTKPFKDYNGDLDDKFTNTSKLFRDTVRITEISDKIIKLLRNNNNIKSIKALNDIYYKIKNESLVDLLLKIIPIVGGINPNSWMKVPDVEFASNLIINSLVNNYADAKIINFAIGNLKTRNIKYMIEKLFKRRANQPESYKQSVADVYKQKYGKTLESVLVDALTDKYLNIIKEDDIKLIKIMIPKYVTKSTDAAKTPVAGATTGKLQ